MTNHRSHVSKGTRDFVFARGNGKCERCGTSIAIDTFHCAHLRAVASGGTSDVANLQAWCHRCNLTNGSRDAGDPRIGPLEWQSDALNLITDRILSSGAATVAAAPGAGKTIFAGLVFEALREAGLVERMVAFVPKRALVEQWAESLLRARQLQLKTFEAIERLRQVGTIVTYQSLASRDELNAHVQMTTNRPTLLVFDEVHHLGDRHSGGRPAWARNVAELAGEIDDLRVPAVLNLSGTLWRSAPTERISTVRYRTLDEGRLQSDVDYSVTSEELVLRGHLRPIDLYRLGSKIRLSDYKEASIIQGNLSDLDEQQSRAAVANLGAMSQWRTAFVSAILDRLEWAHRALGGYHAKALIVASRQDHAAAFRDEVDRQMRSRRLSPLAALAVSDEKDAPQVLKDFRAQRRSGVLCTVDMAGEGYDCADIAVLGYASNKLTALYVRQVIARAMRVTQRERELGFVIPAAVVLPNAQPLVEQLVAYLYPFTAEVLVPQDEESDEMPRSPSGQLDIFNMAGVRFSLDSATADSQVVTVPYSDKSSEDMDGMLVEQFAQELHRVGVPGVFSARVIAASRRTVGNLRDSHPFEKFSADVRVLEMLAKGVAAVEKAQAPVSVSAMAVEDRAVGLQAQLKTCAGWWDKNGNTGVAFFQSDINKAAGIPPGGRDRASVDQLTKALDYARRRINVVCSETGKKPPRLQA